MHSKEIKKRFQVKRGLDESFNFKGRENESEKPWTIPAAQNDVSISMMDGFSFLFRSIINLLSSTVAHESWDATSREKSETFN